MRAVLVHADDTAAGNGRIDTALAIARALGGALSVAVDTPIDRFAAPDALGLLPYPAEAVTEALRADDAFARAVETRLADCGVPVEVVRSTRDPLMALGDAARLADLVVVARDDALATDLPFAAGAPVLALGRDDVLTLPLAAACVAWNGSSEGANALRAAVPLLAKCGAITVLEVDGGEHDGSVDQAVAYLALHGITAQGVQVSRAGRSVADTLAGACAERGASLLVMGAFGHSRLGEAIFGGVSRAMLDRERGPALLVAH